jgi:hypothetical protein
MLWGLSVLIVCCAADGSLSWSEYMQLLADPPQYRLANTRTFGAVTGCSWPTVFDPALNVTWLFDSAALNTFPGKGAAFMLRSIGLTEETIRGLAALNDTCLIVFEPPGDVVPTPSTWEGLVSVVEQFSPVAAARAALMVEALRNVSFEDIMGVHAMTDANYRDPVLDAEALSWTREKYESAAAVDLFATRAFLFNVLGANNLFLGNGFSYSSNYGEPQNHEYVCKQLLKVELPKSTAVKVNF